MIVLGVLIFAHELGHFLFAKLSGVGVLKFSLGFGKKIVGFKRGETEYLISAFPLGGYVKMIGEEDGEELSPEDKKRAFNNQPVYKRLAIVFAGPFFNIVLAVLLCSGLYMAGFPTPYARVAEVAPGSIAMAAGFLPDDVVMKVDGEDVEIWDQLSDYVSDHPSKELTFTVRRQGVLSTLKATPANVNGKGSLGLSGVVLIGSVLKGSPADKAGVNVKDRVLKINGGKVSAWRDIVNAVTTSKGEPLTFTVLRDGKESEFKVIPVQKEEKGKDKAPEKRFVVGVQIGAETENVPHGPVESLKLGAEKTYFIADMTVGFLARVIKGKEDSSQIGGPIAIVQLSGRQARQGLADFVLFMALLSVNLGVINLVPIPILDGGLLFFLIIETVIRRQPSIRVREIAQQVGLFILISLMVFVFYNDIMRLLGFADMWK